MQSRRIEASGHCLRGDPGIDEKLDHRYAVHRLPPDGGQKPVPANVIVAIAMRSVLFCHEAADLVLFECLGVDAEIVPGDH